MALIKIGANPCQKPTGLLGRFVLWNMNSRHSKVTDWGLSRISIAKNDTILDVGCGGGRTVNKLSRAASGGKVYGIDFSPQSVAIATRVNRELIAAGRVEIREASVSSLPFANDTFDLVSAVETHFWWPDLKADMCEVRRVLKPGGTLIVIAEIYKGADTKRSKLMEKYLPQSGIKLLTVGEHRELFADAGYSDIRIIADPATLWICCIGKKL